MSSTRRIYRVIFLNQGHLYELYASAVSQSDMYGFIEVEAFLFGERAQMVVDPGEERLKNEFSGVKRSWIPMHAVVRIDEVEKQGIGKITEASGASIHAFPPGPGPGPGGRGGSTD